MNIPTRRLVLPDLARGFALLAMALYHGAWDFDFFGLTTLDAARDPYWKTFALGIASSFLFLVGVGLVLAHGEVTDRSRFIRRLTFIMLAAAGVTLATRIVTPEAPVYFGILHAIALSSVLGLAFLRLPALLTLAAALPVLLAPHYLRMPFFDAPYWLWLGLGTVEPRSNDYVPLLPWLAPVLIGIAFARLVPPERWPRPAGTSPPARLLRLIGRHSLAFYLLHQPILFMLAFGLLQLVGPAQSITMRNFYSACQATCQRDSIGVGDCAARCTCLSDGMGREKLWSGIGRDKLSEAQTLRFHEVVKACVKLPGP